MAYVPVPKDLTKVKTKVMFNLTKRQLICFTGGALIGVPLFFLLRKPTGNSVAAMCMMLVMLPFFMMAMYEKHGQPLEKIVGNILKVAVIRPKQRPYNLSYQANSACKEAIEQTISAHYAENRLDTEAAVKDVLEKFGTERVQFILANTIQRKNYDGRISQDNKAWAKSIPTLEDSGASRHCAYLVVDQVNPGLTDLFTRQFRKVAQEQQKSSVLQKLKQEPPARKPATPKKREPER